jgi:5-methyltetrahydrofolate--homocysteine methyltransferase
MSRLLETLHSGRILLMDGAMGTELQRAGSADGECHEAWNLFHPERVQAIHRSYAEAGAKVFLTNTFQANPPAAAKHGQQQRMHDIIAAGLSIARSAAGADGFVLAAFGPAAGLTRDQLARMTEAAGGADAILLETISDVAWIATLAPQTSWNPRRLPLFVSWTFCTHPQGINAELEHIVHAVEDLGAAALGVNCGRDVDMDFIAAVIRYFRAHTALPLFARPNAGTPSREDGGCVYPWAPAHMTARLPAVLDAGVCMVGGCCGTTPAHIAAFRPMIAQRNAEKTV